jgi:hypothetical protein
MKTLDKPNSLRLITLFSGAVKGMAFYPTSHPAIRQPLLDLYKILTSALNANEQVSWGLIDGIMFLDDHLFVSPTTAIADLSNQMIEKKISRIVATSSLSFEEMETFVKLFAVKGANFDTLSRQMDEAGITSLALVRHGDESFDRDNIELEDKNEHDGNHVETYNRALSAIKSICLDI